MVSKVTHDTDRVNSIFVHMIAYTHFVSLELTYSSRHMSNTYERYICVKYKCVSDAVNNARKIMFPLLMIITFYIITNCSNLPFWYIFKMTVAY